MSVLASIVDWDAMLQLIWVGALSGVGVTAAFGLGLLGVTRASDLSRDGRGGVAVLYGALGVLGLATVAGALVFGVVVMAQK
jgi:hypothetical protein